MKSGICIALFAAIAVGPATAIEGTWSNDFHLTGPDDKVECLLVWNGDAYAGGSFDAVGPVLGLHRVARWHDGAWEAVGDPIPTHTVLDLCVHDGVLHALGYVTGGRAVWRLDAGNWQQVGSEVDTGDGALASYLGQLYLGRFRLEDGDWVDRLQTDDDIQGFTVSDGLLVAGGDFASAAGIATGHVLAWDGTNVLAAFLGQDLPVQDVETWGGRLYAGRDGGHEPVTAVQVWQDDAWIDVPELGEVHAYNVLTDLRAERDHLLVTTYAIQLIIKAEASRSPALQAWDGVQAVALYSAPANVRFNAAVEYGGGVLLGGDFGHSGSDIVANLGLVRNGDLEGICVPGLGATGTGVTAFGSGSEGLAVGGYFSVVGGVECLSVAVLDQGGWTPYGLDHGFVGHYYGVSQLIWHEGSLGAFAHGMGIASYIVWLGSLWYDFDDYLPTPYDLVSWDGRVLGPADNAVYEYSPGDAVPFAAVTGTANCLLPLGDDLVIGGLFDTVAGVAAGNIAMLVDGVWQPLGGGLPDRVVALAAYGDHLAAATVGPGDDFDVTRLMIWDGAAWHDQAELTGGRLRAMVEYAGCLILGGEFDLTDPDGVPMTGIACWTGTRWQSIGVAAETQALAVHDGTLWVGGDFERAGGQPASHLSTFTAMVTIAPDPEPLPHAVDLAAPTPNPFNPCTTIRFELPRTADVLLEVFDAGGRRVATVFEGSLDAGHHGIVWRGTDSDGRSLPSGTYLFRLQAGLVSQTVKATLVR